jgi:deoxyribose-phosphate aldolase
LTPDAIRIAKALEHTLLRPEATPAEIDALCDEAVRFGFAGVCVNPIYTQRVADRLSAARKSALFVVAPVGFPLGANRTESKADEARQALDDGATEIDMVAALGALVGGEAQYVRADIEAVAHVVHRAAGRCVLKVILETAALTAEQIILGCRCCAEGEADFVKTSTGFHPRGGATVEHVRLLHRHAAPMRVKASGGIRTAAAVRAMLEAGAARIGTSAGVSIMEELSAVP